jgi:hypothetical protein
MGAICSSEMSADFQRNTRRYIQEDKILHNHRCYSLRSYKKWLSSWPDSFVSL